MPQNLQDIPDSKLNDVARVNKALETTSFLNGGRLDATQQRTYEDFIRGTNDMMGAIDIRFTDRLRGKIDKLFFGKHVLRAGTENTNFTDLVDPTFAKDEYTLQKLTGGFNVDYEVMVENLEQDNFKSTLINRFLKKAANDISEVAVNGDTTCGLDLLDALDGFYKLSDTGHIYDAGGSEINRGVFHSSFRTMPKEFRRSKSDLRWFANSVLQDDYQEVLGNRATGYGDVNAQGGNLTKAIGIPFLTCDEIYDNYAVDYGAATRAEVVGTVQGTFTITTGSNDGFEFDIDNTEAGAPTTFTLTAGEYTANQMAAHMNSLLSGTQPEAVSTDGNGRIVISSPTTGAASEVEVQATANDCYTTLGLTAAVTAGDAVGSNSINYGTYMLLTNPMNLRAYILREFRTYWEYVPRSDRWEFTFQHYMQPHILWPMALVRAEGIKLSDY